MNKPLAFVAIALSLAGCAHLEQAPLVYTSRTALGVDVSAGAADAPGLSMTVGYKQVDAAYVPVAVARACGEASSRTCADDAYPLKVIAGSSEDGNSSDDRDAEEVAAKADADAFALVFEQSLDAATLARQQQRAATNNVKELRSQIEPLAAAQSQFEQRKEELERLNARAQELDAAPAEGNEGERGAVREKIEEIERLRPKVDALATLATLQRQLEGANADLDKANADVAVKQDEVARRRSQLAQKRDAIMQMDKHDSYSVFGSFETRTEGRSSEASVGIGKIFATGVASQDISRGLADMYRTRDVTACYEVIAKSAVADADKLEKLLKTCRKQ